MTGSTAWPPSAGARLAVQRPGTPYGLGPEVEHYRTPGGGEFLRIPTYGQVVDEDPLLRGSEWKTSPGDVVPGEARQQRDGALTPARFHPILGVADRRLHERGAAGRIACVTEESAMPGMSRRQILAGMSAAAALAALPERGAAATGKIKPGRTDVLLVVDVQNCFVPGGTLPVKEGDQIIPLINRIARGFEHVVLTQDWHTPGHASFASSHQGKKPFEMVDLAYGKQVLWPDHCVQGTPDADLHRDLTIPHAQLVIRKGYRKHIDSYSAFFEADGKTSTGLTGYLRHRGLKQVFLAGLATDFCVAWSALDARKSGFAALVVEDACRGIDTEGSLTRAWDQMKQAGVKRIQSSDLDV